MRYASLQASLTHALAERGEKDANGNEIKPVGKIYDTFEEYQSSKGNKITETLNRMKIMTNVLKNFAHLPLAVMSNDLGWGGRSNFQTQRYAPEKSLDSLSDCLYWLEHWEDLQGEWWIFDGTTLTFYMSDNDLVERCKQSLKNYIHIETINFDAINFVVGFPYDLIANNS